MMTLPKLLPNRSNLSETTTPYFTTNDGTTAEYDTITEPTTTMLPDFESLIVTREQWDASEVNSSIVSKLETPIKRIIIAHTRGQFCANKVSKIMKVLFCLKLSQFLWSRLTVFPL